MARPADYYAPSSWELIARDHRPKVFRQALRLTGNRNDAEDLTQDVMVRVFKSVANFRPGSFDGWLHRITTNVFLDQARRKSRVRFQGLPENADDRLAATAEADMPQNGFHHNNLDYDVQQALLTLNEDQRTAVVLCDVDGLSYEEISQMLGWKMGTVRSRIHRGRAMLRDALAHRAPAAP